MSPSADASASSSPAEILGFRTGQIVQEIGYDDDVDLDLRDAIEDAIDDDLEDEDSQELVDGVVIWWRDGDGDLTDQLVDSLSNLAENAPVWLLTPKAGRPSHVSPASIEEAAEIAGMRVMNAVSLAADWSGTRLASRQG
ncbi:MAG: DUF3052 domain-containing protein [Brachybacterium sp.]|nr:DUF3052 domain-containing protein [Brachybacterium sp.]